MVDAIEGRTSAPIQDAALSVLLWPGAGQASQGRSGMAAYFALEALACVVVYFAAPGARVFAMISLAVIVAWAGIDAYFHGKA